VRDALSHRPQESGRSLRPAGSPYRHFSGNVHTKEETNEKTAPEPVFAANLRRISPHNVARPSLVGAPQRAKLDVKGSSRWRTTKAPLIDDNPSRSFLKGDLHFLLTVISLNGERHGVADVLVIQYAGQSVYPQHGDIPIGEFSSG